MENMADYTYTKSKLKSLVNKLLSNWLPVAWLRVDTQTILSIQNHVITKNHRIGITHTEHRIWQLKIRDVRESDRGWYMCQINTDPMKSQVGFLDVIVPPDIIDFQTSQDMVVGEGQNISLTCRATGMPTPTIHWRREKDLPIISINGQGVYVIEGPNITLWKVDRYNMGAYLCIATNGVPPTVSKRISIVVNFAPTMWTRYDTIYISYGQKITLECLSEANPTTVNFWTKNKNFIQGGTYESLTFDNVFKIIMRLTIRPLKMSDFGEYKCVAKNMMGEAERTISIHHKAKKGVHFSPQPGNQLIVVEEYMSSAAAGTGFKILLIFGFIFIFF